MAQSKKKKTPEAKKKRRIDLGSFSVGERYGKYDEAQKHTPPASLYAYERKGKLKLSIAVEASNVEVDADISLTKEEGVAFTKYLMSYYDIK